MTNNACYSLLTLLLYIATVSAANCNAGWESFGGSCYKFVVTGLSVRGKTWENAENTCQSYGGHLTSITNQTEQNFITGRIKQYTNEHFWIGYNDRANESSFNWTDGADPTAFTRWRRGEPNDFQKNEDCVELLYQDGIWNDDDCSKEYSFICKMPQGVLPPIQPTLVPPTTSTPLYCDAGWFHYGTSCYKLNGARKKWTVAQRDCHQSGGYLVKVENGDEQHYLTYMMKTMMKGGAWIGLSDRTIEGTYVWEGDQTMLGKNYTHWYSGEPNDHAGLEDCISMYSGMLAGFWNDDYCDTEKAYICEKPNGHNLCPVNWVPFGDSCYMLNTHPAQASTWQQANNACRDAMPGSDLVSVLSSDEQLFLVGQLKDLQSSNVWIGLNDMKTEGIFVWSDRSVLKYKNWAQLEPYKWGADSKDCVQMSTNNPNSSWVTDMCSNKKPYVCKKTRASMKCDAPFGLANYLIDNSQITASSSKNVMSGPGLARLRIQPMPGSSGAWCARKNSQGEYLQIDLGLNRRIGHIALQGRPKSSDFIKTFYLRYGDDGTSFINYGENGTEKYLVLQGSSDSDAIANIMLSEAINARFLRIYPLTWSNNICMRCEVYGCSSPATSKKCGMGWEEGPDDTCYQYNTNMRKIWADARATCFAQGSDLLSIVTNNEKAYIESRVKSLASSVGSLWIGLNDREADRLFYWSDRRPFVITRWDAGYPTDRTDSKSCVELVASRAAWRDVDCGQYKPFICKRVLKTVNTKKVSRTANWISTADYYWPLDNIVKNRVLGTTTATVSGNVSHPDILQNGRDVLEFSPSASFLDAGSYPGQCVGDAAQCIMGLTLSFILKLDSNAASWPNKVFLVDSIGDELFATSRGFSVYIESGRLKVKVMNKAKSWSLSTYLPRAGIWNHVIFTWQETAGVKVYVNGRLSATQAWQKYMTPQHTSNIATLTIGSKSSQQATGSYFMRSLAIWKRVLGTSVIMDTYNAEFGNCKTGWKDFGQYCYQFNSDKKTWQAARLQCQSQGGDLVSILSPVEQAHITLEVGLFGIGTYAWIGFHDKSIESAWEWSDGSPVQFTNWYKTQPDNYYNIEDCAHTYQETRAAGRWNDMSCTDNLGYICKAKKAYIPIAGLTPTTAPKTQVICQYASATLSCPASTTIVVQTATFGRTSSAHCGQISITNCRLDATTRIKDICEGNSFCTVRPTVGMFGGNDPCRNVSKYLEVTYYCKKGVVATPGCPAGWQRSPDGNVCYGLILDKKTWSDARDSCRAMGAELASIHNRWESSMVTSLLVTSWDAGDVWIGLTDANQRGIYRWIDGSPVDWTHWWNGEPDDRSSSGSCVRATMTASSRDWMYWIDSDCTDNTYAYVCKTFRRNYTPLPVTPTTGATGPCPAGWLVYKNGCYKVSMTPKTWTAARDACRTIGDTTDLVSVHDAAENNFVQSLVNSTFNIWIGLNDRGSISGHLWSDGTAVQYTRWGPAEPDSHSGQQPCVALKSTGYWSDVGCYSTRPYMCKQKRPARATTSGPSTSAPVITTPVAGICDDGWMYWSGNGLCYFFSNESSVSKMSWMEARDNCRKSRGDLVSLRSAAENVFVHSQVKKRYFAWTAWIGLSDRGSEGLYAWSDGLPLSYTNWGNLEPNDWKGMEDCAEMSRYDGRWNDNACHLKRSFICRKHNTTIFPPFTMVPPSAGPAVGKCDPGWVNYDKSCYKFVFKQFQNWLNAESVCAKGQNSTKAGHLVTIDNAYEQAFLTTMVSGFQGTVWIGLNDRHTEGTYGWIDNSAVGYTNWMKGKPGWGWSSDCGKMSGVRGSEGQWDMDSCSAFQGYICETDALPLGPTPVTPSVTPSADCPSPYTKFGDSCYMMYYDKLNWKEAREVCKKNGADLISIHSALQQAYLVRNMKDFSGDVWTGMMRGANSLEFMWSDQSSKQFTLWASGQPGQPGASQTCVQAGNSKNSNGRWAAVDCGSQNGFMCMIYKGEPQVTPSLLGQCLPGWKKFDKYCYQFNGNSRGSWPRVRMQCNQRGAELVSITNREEHDFVSFQLRQASSSGDIWTGLNDRAVEHGWQWSDGSPLTYVAWSAGEPNDNIGNANCVEMLASNGLWNDQQCSSYKGFVCKSKLECSFPLGMSSGNITDAQLSVSSTLASGYGANMGRLNSSTAWCANVSIPNNYIQVDFIAQTRVSKISIKGTTYGGRASYVQSYTVSYGSYKNEWQDYKQNGRTKICSGNSDATNVVTLAFDPPIDARFLRLYPQTWSHNACAKLEFYGCPFECETPRGMGSGKLQDEKITASSSLGSAHAPPQARPQGKAWCPQTSDKNPWIQISFQDEKRLTKISTWGGGSGGFVSNYRLGYSDDGVTWSDYTEKGVVRNFRGNIDSDTRLTHVIGDPIKTKYFRVKPLVGASAGRCLRFELYGCPSGCNAPQGLELGTIEDSWITSSSSLDERHSPDMARLNAPRGWCAASNDINQFIQVDLSRPMRVGQIATQGSSDGTGYVMSFKLQFKRDDTKWKNVNENSAAKVFTANHDSNTVVKTTLPKTVRGQYWRVVPLTWSNTICIRMELYGCLPNNPATVSPPTEKPSGNPTEPNTVAPTEPPFVVYQVTMRLTATEWSDDYSKSSSAAFKTLAAQVESSVSSVYSGTTDKDSLAFKSAKVTAFRSGSVIVDYNITFITDIAEGTNVTAKLRSAVSSGKVGELQVDPKYFSIKEVVPSGGKTKPHKGGRTSGLSTGAKAAIAVVFVIAILAGVAVGTWFIYKRKRAGKLQFKHQTFDNPIHFSSKAYDMES